MPLGHAAPVPTITDGCALTDSPPFMVGHREETQRGLDRELKAGLPPLVVLTKVDRAIKAAIPRRVMHWVELPYAIA